eukprot:TRINITY_DN10119_c0_g1_i5.p1 TRINITY_DN10119_c0_g1~~TRINITY_DN10119_c0_g1_i5.p1  ORF type:complete len:248 (+),score=-14.93 TRINITY_DN10119_c0_g1_i5:242-985(+)
MGIFEKWQIAIIQSTLQYYNTLYYSTYSKIKVVFKILSKKTIECYEIQKWNFLQNGVSQQLPRNFNFNYKELNVYIFKYFQVVYIILYIIVYIFKYMSVFKILLRKDDFRLQVSIQGLHLNKQLILKLVAQGLRIYNVINIFSIIQYLSYSKQFLSFSFPVYDLTFIIFQFRKLFAWCFIKIFRSYQLPPFQLSNVGVFQVEHIRLCSSCDQISFFCPFINKISGTLVCGWLFCLRPVTKSRGERYR